MLFVGFKSQSQCKTCSLEGDFDYCYSQEAFGSFCASFKDGESTFKILTGKRPKVLPLTNSVDTNFLLELAENRKLKISAKEMLFISAALKMWAIESRKYGYSEEESGLGIKIIQEGSGALPENGMEVTVHYTGWLLDGTKFDSSIDRGTPFKFKLGQGRVIKGWDEGVSKLKIGSKAFLKIPSKLGYGARGAGRSIPPNSTLIFEIDVLE